MTLNEVLMLAGRLDDSPGFDTPRERFRRFLGEHAAEVPVIRTFIEQCQRSPGEQHRRALQDLVVILGRCLGFETTFGTYLHAPGAPPDDGHWRIRPRAHLVLEIRTDQTPGSDLQDLSRAVAAAAEASNLVSGARPMGLCVVAPLCPGRHKLEEALGDSRPDVPLRLVSLRALLTLADLVHAGRVMQPEVMRLFGSALTLDDVVDLLDRVAGAGKSGESRVSDDAGLSAREERGFWMATVAGDLSATPEELVSVVIGGRNILGVSADGRVAGAARPGDSICFYIPDRGVVGHAEVASCAQNGTGLREAHRFSRVLHLTNTELHVDQPVLPDVQTQLRLRAMRRTGDAAPPPLIRLSEQEFVALVTASGEASRREEAEAADAAVSVADLPSRG